MFSNRLDYFHTTKRKKMKVNSLVVIFGLLLMSFSCMTNKEKLIEKINSLGFPGNEIVVTIDEFFEGNNDPGSIGVNIYPNQPTPNDFYNKFKELKALNTIDDIYVRISDLEGEWPYTDTVYVITTLNKDELAKLLSPLQPDEIYKGWMYKKPINAPKVLKGFSVYSVWWD